MKKLILLFLVATLCLLIVGCDSKNKDVTMPNRFVHTGEKYKLQSGMDCYTVEDTETTVLYLECAGYNWYSFSALFNADGTPITR